MLESICDSKDQKIVQLNLEGYDNKEIAKIIRVNERTIRNRLDAIQRRLVEELKR